MKKIEKITVWGVVQGVGFRPFITRLARTLELSGNVRNSGGIVEIEIAGPEAKIDAFVEAIERQKPEPSEILGLRREKIPTANINEGQFEIIKSDSGSDMVRILPTDIGICDSCLEEITDLNNRRYKYAYNSCTACGPRYSIVDKVPYDRENTTMRDYMMCENCKKEYTLVDDRRYHAQTISCHECGPYPIYIGYDQAEAFYEREDAIVNSIDDIRQAKVIALKGNGGYYLVCEAGNERAVKRLRYIKGREDKPFAVMFHDINLLRDFVEFTQEEARLLKSSARPIILLNRKNDGGRISPEVYRGSRYQGAFLPSLGIQEILLKACGPLVMTSANKSDMPIIKDDEEALDFCKKEGIPVLYNTRKIITRLDDSVIRIIDGQTQMVRRSKGYVPSPIYIESLLKSPSIFAAGGDLKSTYSLAKKGFIFVSEFFGDLDSLEKQEVYKASYKHMKNLLNIEPDLFVCDMHPSYNTRKITSEIAEKSSLPILYVQHHHAHIASVMAEHKLDGPLIGVAFDGTGYGTDGNIWGGEVLICENEVFERYSHLKYVSLSGGDEGARDAWKSAVAYKHARFSEGEKLIKPGFEGEEFADKLAEFTIDMEKIFDYYHSNTELELSQEDLIKRGIVDEAIGQGINVYKTSSMGRLFDAVSSLLGIQHINSYEGESAIMLENAALEAIEGSDNEQSLLALDFHKNVAKAILEESKKIRDLRRINQVALSGGVFQNKVLMEETLSLLRENGFEVYYNISLPTNDGGICLGQSYIGMKSFKS